MAIDTDQKRASVIGFADDMIPQYVPNVSGIDTSSDRGQQVFLYAAGVSSGGSSPSGVLFDSTMNRRIVRR